MSLAILRVSGTGREVSSIAPFVGIFFARLVARIANHFIVSDLCIPSWFANSRSWKREDESSPQGHGQEGRKDANGVFRPWAWFSLQAYGTERVLFLAKTHPDLAIHNAANYEMFATDVAARHLGGQFKSEVPDGEKGEMSRKVVERLRKDLEVVDGFKVKEVKDGEELEWHEEHEEHVLWDCEEHD
jgi:hypothetical protein